MEKKKRGRPKKIQSVTEAYYATIKVFNQFHEAKGETAREAIENLKPEGICRGISVLTLQHADKQQEKVLPKLITFRLFSKNPMMRAVALRQVTERFSI